MVSSSSTTGSDTWEGNGILKLVAAGLRDSCCETDYVARMGRDEFVLVLPSLSLKNVAGKMNVLETMALVAGIALCGERVLSISIGTVSFRSTVAMPRVSWQRRTAGCIWPYSAPDTLFPPRGHWPRHL
jgi:predicted signal transduction protein with EAL and GGDEF domain